MCNYSKVKIMKIKKMIYIYWSKTLQIFDFDVVLFIHAIELKYNPNRPSPFNAAAQ